MAYLSLNNISLEWIRAFEVAGRTGSFTAAAQEINVTQAAISQRITHLERRIGSHLFVRNARGVTLSVDGEAWLPYVTNALHELDSSYEGLFGVKRNKITISASASITELWFAPRMSIWTIDQNLHIVFSTMVLESDDQNSNVNVKVRYGAGSEWPDCYRTPLFKEALCPVASPQLLNQKDPWYELPRIALTGPRAGWQEWARQTGDPTTPVPTIRFDSMSSALSAAVSGAGVLIASLPLCSVMIEEKKLVRVSQQLMQPPETYWMIASKSDIFKSEVELRDFSIFS